MRANFTWVLLFALFCCNIPPASSHPVSPFDHSVESPGNALPNLASLSQRSILPRSDNSTTSGHENTPLPANLIAAIAATGVGVLLVLIGLMTAFRLGWSKGLEYQEKEERRLHSAGSSDTATEPTLVPWPGEPTIVCGILGRHSFKPGEGVYEIQNRPDPRATMNGFADIVAKGKDKETGLGTW
ncbi:hypothetical protein B9Z19DRAFT_1049638 [Tuber borchii]|uniref:Uncharacterized protein n=1 Tax=Tuber borchii TaxID=42251 RepID=A0A2T6ZQN8_TUBBO|nr:hypothetical protein B9Z19DRAFT_1049638 [Tuber borchii]